MRTIRQYLTEITGGPAPISLEADLLDVLIDNVIESDRAEYDPKIDEELTRISAKAETGGSVDLETFRRFQSLMIDRSRSESKYYIGVGIRIALELDRVIRE